MTPEQEKRFRERLAAEEASPEPEKSDAVKRFEARLAAEKQATKEQMLNPITSAGVGTALSFLAAKPIATFTEGFQKPKASTPQPVTEVPVAEAAPAAKEAAVPKWTKTQLDGDYYGGRDYASAYQRGQDVRKTLAETPGYGAAQGSGLMAPREALEEFEARKAAQEALEKRSQMSFGEKFAERYPRTSSVGSRLGAGASNVIMKGMRPTTGKAAVGTIGGIQAADAYNRYIQGDIPGAALSGVGSLGTAAMLVPNPKVRAVGALTSLLGSGANLLRNPEIEPTTPEVPEYVKRIFNKAEGGIVGYAKGKAVKALKELNPFDLTKLEGKTILGTMSDRTAVDLARNLYGGPMFPRIHEGAAWGVDSPGAASRLLNAMNEAGGPKNVVVSPMLMSPGAHKSNRDVSKIALKEFQKNFQEGKFGPERLAEIEMSARKIPGLESLGGLTEAEALDALNRMTFKQRGDLVERLGSKPKTAPALDLSKVLRETTEPGIEGAELGAIGPSIFTLSGHKSVNPALHGSYSQILHGDLLGEMPTIPRQFVFRNLEARAMKELGRPLSDYNYRTSVGVPSQLVDEKLLRSWDELGFLKPKTGGVNNPE